MCAMVALAAWKCVWGAQLVDYVNGPLCPRFQTEAWCSSFHMKMTFHLHANENKFLYERMSTQPRFEKKAKGNSEMAFPKNWVFSFRILT